MRYASALAQFNANRQRHVAKLIKALQQLNQCDSASHQAQDNVVVAKVETNAP